nr:uncharacterized protein LOC124906977 [Homo sapiens]
MSTKGVSKTHRATESHRCLRIPPPGTLRGSRTAARPHFAVPVPVHVSGQHGLKSSYSHRRPPSAKCISVSGIGGFLVSLTSRMKLQTLLAEFSTSFEQPRFSHHLQIMEDTGQSPRSHGQPFPQLRSHWQAPRQGWPAQEGGGRRPSRREEAAALAGGGKRTAPGLRGRGGRAAAGQGGDRHPDRWRRQRMMFCSGVHHKRQGSWPGMVAQANNPSTLRGRRGTIA